MPLKKGGGDTLASPARDLPLKSLMPLKLRTFLSDLTDLSDLSGKPRAGLASCHLSSFLSGMEYLSDTHGFKWHVPLKSVMSLTKTRFF